jgi:hypothetical protein
MKDFLNEKQKRLIRMILGVIFYVVMLPLILAGVLSNCREEEK